MGVWYALACDSRQSWVYIWCEGPSRNTRLLSAQCENFSSCVIQLHNPIGNCGEITDTRPGHGATYTWAGLIGLYAYAMTCPQ